MGNLRPAVRIRPAAMFHAALQTFPFYRNFFKLRKKSKKYNEIPFLHFIPKLPFLSVLVLVRCVLVLVVIITANVYFRYLCNRYNDFEMLK